MYLKCTRHISFFLKNPKISQLFEIKKVNDIKQKTDIIDLLILRFAELKSLGTKCRAGSIPAPGTRNQSPRNIDSEGFFIQSGASFHTKLVF